MRIRMRATPVTNPATANTDSGTGRITRCR